MLPSFLMGRSGGKSHKYAFVFALLILICTAMTIAGTSVERRYRAGSGLWVTFDTSGERFRALVTDPEAISYVLAFVAGRAAPKIPKGNVMPGGDANAPWSWHLDPKTLHFEDQGDRVDCNTLPSRIEQLGNLATRKCGFSNARIVRVEDCRTGQCVALRGLYAGRSPY